MEKVKIIQEDDQIKIGKIVLTADAIETLEKFQYDSNNRLNEYIESLANAVCLFAKAQFDFGKDFETDAKSLIVELSFIHGDLRLLKSTLKIEQPTEIE